MPKLLGPGAARGSAAETIHVGKSSDIAFTFVPVDVGIHEKFFDKAGIDVEVVNLAGSAKLQQALIASTAPAEIAALMTGAIDALVSAAALGSISSRTRRASC